MLNILGINGATTKSGMVSVMLNETLEACELWAQDGNIDVECETIHLKDSIKEFVQPEQNLVPQQSQIIVDKMIKADIVIFATPVFWFAPSPLISQLLVDIVALEYDRDFLLSGRIAGVLAHCDEDGAQQACNSIMGPLLHYGFMLPPYAAVWRNRAGAKYSEGKWQLDFHQKVLAKNLIALAAVTKHLRTMPG